MSTRRTAIAGKMMAVHPRILLVLKALIVVASSPLVPKAAC
jgi:hypothetical protein